MRHSLVFLMIVPVAIIAACGMEYPDFGILSQEEKLEVVRNLQNENLWGKPEYKLVYMDLIATQGGGQMTPDIVIEAINVVEVQGWRDMDDLIQSIYDHPKDILLYRRAFKYLRKQSGRLPSEYFLQAIHIIGEYGIWSPGGQSITVEQVHTAQKRLIDESDKEIVLVYTLFLAVHPSDSPQPSTRASVKVLKTLDRGLLRSRLKNFRIEWDSLGYRKTALRWVATELGISLVEE